MAVGCASVTTWQFPLGKRRIRETERTFTYYQACRTLRTSASVAVGPPLAQLLRVSIGRNGDKMGLWIIPKKSSVGWNGSCPHPVKKSFPVF